jgi:hypothetical protein
VAFELFGQAWVLFRSAQGGVSCVRDECAHRACPLSLGRVVDGSLECAYHVRLCAWSAALGVTGLLPKHFLVWRCWGGARKSFGVAG